MTRVMLIESLKEFIAKSVSSFSLPCKPDKGDTEQIFRAPTVHRMRLPDSTSATKKAPYIIVQFVHGKDEWKTGDQSAASAVVRLIFCVYNEDEEEGAMALMNVMEKVRKDMLEVEVIGDCFRLGTDNGLESLVYPEDTAPFYAGEMIGTFEIPPIERHFRHYFE